MNSKYKQSPFHVTPEMVRLRSDLDMLGIEWKDQSSVIPEDHWICRTWFWINHNKWSVIHGYGTYGGYSYWLDRDDMRLELTTSTQNGGEPIGYLTAKEIIELVKEELEKSK